LIDGQLRRSNAWGRSSVLRRSVGREYSIHRLVHTVDKL